MEDLPVVVSAHEADGFHLVVLRLRAGKKADGLIDAIAVEQSGEGAFHILVDAMRECLAVASYLCRQTLDGEIAVKVDLLLFKELLYLDKDPTVVVAVGMERVVVDIRDIHHRELGTLGVLLDKQLVGFALFYIKKEEDADHVNQQKDDQRSDDPVVMLSAAHSGSGDKEVAGFAILPLFVERKCFFLELFHLGSRLPLGKKGGRKCNKKEKNKSAEAKQGVVHKTLNLRVQK